MRRWETGPYAAVGLFGSDSVLKEQLESAAGFMPGDDEGSEDPDWVAALTMEQRRHLRRLLWEQGQILYLDSPIFSAALELRFLGNLLASAQLAIERPNSRPGRSLAGRTLRFLASLRPAKAALAVRVKRSERPLRKPTELADGSAPGDVDCA
jgi:hypothetical protein